MAEIHKNKKECRCIDCGCHIAGGYQKVSPGRGICAACMRRRAGQK